MANQMNSNSPSLLARAIEVFAAYKVTKGVVKFVIAPAALAGGAYLIYKRVSGNHVNA